MKKKTRIMLVEDHAGYRETITMALKLEDSMELVSQFGTAEIALRNLQESEPKDLPDVILLDLNLPGMSGIEALPWALKYVPRAQIIVLTQHKNSADIQRAIVAGASGYLLKSSTLKQIVEGIQTVVSGGASLSPEVARFILNSIRRVPKPDQPEKTLSKRELEILELLGEGLLKKEIASKLNISITTVAYHVKHIYEKLNVANAPAAISEAYKSGILPSD